MILENGERENSATDGKTCYCVCDNVIYLCTTILAVRVLQGLWRNDLVALRGACPNCGEEVSLIKSDTSCRSSFILLFSSTSILAHMLNVQWSYLLNLKLAVAYWFQCLPCRYLHLWILIRLKIPPIEQIVMCVNPY